MIEMLHFIPVLGHTQVGCGFTTVNGASAV